MHSPAPKLSTPRDKSVTCCRWQTDDESWRRASRPLLREFRRLTISTRDCLTAEPWASEAARQIPSLFCSSNCVQQFTSISESACQVTVFPSKFLYLIIAFRCILPNSRRQTNLRQ